MAIGVYSILDKSAGLYGRPYFSPGDQAAVRAFRVEVDRVADGNMMNMYPQDFDLYRIGAFDEHTGELICEPPRVLAAGKSGE